MPFHRNAIFRSLFWRKIYTVNGRHIDIVNFTYFYIDFYWVHICDFSLFYDILISLLFMLFCRYIWYNKRESNNITVLHLTRRFISTPVFPHVQLCPSSILPGRVTRRYLVQLWRGRIWRPKIRPSPAISIGHFELSYRATSVFIEQLRDGAGDALSSAVTCSVLQTHEIIILELGLSV